jgi:hypothetical protein
VQIYPPTFDASGATIAAVSGEERTANIQLLPAPPCAWRRAADVGRRRFTRPGST